MKRELVWAYPARDLYYKNKTDNIKVTDIHTTKGNSLRCPTNVQSDSTSFSFSDCLHLHLAVVRVIQKSSFQCKLTLSNIWSYSNNRFCLLKEQVSIICPSMIQQMKLHNVFDVDGNEQRQLIHFYHPANTKRKIYIITSQNEEVESEEKKKTTNRTYQIFNVKCAMNCKSTLCHNLFCHIHHPLIVWICFIHLHFKAKTKLKMKVHGS